MSNGVTVIGGGMITHDQLLPALYQLQRLGRIGPIQVCASQFRTVEALRQSPTLAAAFPDQTFTPRPDRPGEREPELFRTVLSQMAPGGLAVVAVPDHLHFDVTMAALKAAQHVLAVKPLVLQVKQAEQIERTAFEAGLFVGIEYHKRLDDRSLMARRKYREGLFGDFRLGTACLLEKWYYRTSNFQNWCTTENSDAFSYIGCHYVDLVHFITGLLPASVSVYGIEDRYPNGNKGYLWTDARVIWNNGACLNVQNAIGFPDLAPGTNTQGLTLYCQGTEGGAVLDHSDQYRGLKHSYTRQPDGPGSTVYAEPSPDYFQYVEYDGPGLRPVGYGYRSVESLVEAWQRVALAPTLEARQDQIRAIDSRGLLATPANSRFNGQVLEAARASIQNRGEQVTIAA
jgi:D-galacturonate reductase